MLANKHFFLYALVVVHQLKWTTSVISTLRQRATRYNKLGLSGWRQSERLLGYLGRGRDSALPT